MKMKEKKKKPEQGFVYSIYLYIYIYISSDYMILYMIYLYIDRSLLQWMQGNIYRDVFPTFLTKKSYGWWITRRTMEIYTKISEEKI